MKTILDGWVARNKGEMGNVLYWYDDKPVRRNKPTRPSARRMSAMQDFCGGGGMKIIGCVLLFYLSLAILGIIEDRINSQDARLAAIEQQIAEIQEFHAELFDPPIETAHGILIPLEETK